MLKEVTAKLFLVASLGSNWTLGENKHVKWLRPNIQLGWLRDLRSFLENIKKFPEVSTVPSWLCWDVYEKVDATLTCTSIREVSRFLVLSSLSQKRPHSPTSIVFDFSTCQKKSIQKRFVSYTRESSLANTVSDTIERISSKYLLFSHRINFHISKIWKT